MSQPNTLENFLRVHDAAFDLWLSGLKVDYPPDPNAAIAERRNMSIIRARATPDRAFASIVDILVNQGYYKDQATAQAMRDKAGGIAVLPLPVVTWMRADPVSDPTLASTTKYFNVHNAQTGKVDHFEWPGHFRIDYTANFWSEKVYTADYIKEWVFGQLGLPGAGNTETFITVQHAPPFGPWIHALRLNDSVDQTALEGPEPRYQRWQMTFSMRGWMMRNPSASFDYVDAASVSVSTLDALGNTTLDDAAPNPQASDNLFVVPKLWTLTGNAQAVSGKKALAGDDLDITFSGAAGDSVDLWEGQLTRTNGYGIASIAFDYQGGPVYLMAGRRDTRDVARSFAQALLLPWYGGFKTLNQFVLFDKNLGSFYLKGQTGAATSVRLQNTAIRRIAPQTQILPATLTATGATYTGLTAGQAYLVAVAVPWTTGGPNAVSGYSDVADGTPFAQQGVDASANAGVAMLLPSKSGSLKLTWPATIAVASTWAQVYNGPYRGNTW